jgi:UDP-3-O-[3-hydroxymyristoyl] glucosamine N-acyltransferase
MLHTLLPAPLSLAEIATLLGAEVVGDGDMTIGGIAHPALAVTGDTLALAMDKGSYLALEATVAKAVIVAADAEIDTDRFTGGLKAGRGRLALAQLLGLFSLPPHTVPGIDPSAVIDASAKVAEDASVGPLSYVGPGAEIGPGAAIMAHVTVGADAKVGRESLLFPGARLGERCVIGERCVVQSNAVIGGDGFGFVTPEPGSIETAQQTGEITAKNTAIVRINSIGNVVLGDDVEIGAGTCIDRGTLSPTEIGSGTKIDNQVQIAHNCRIGENCLIAGQVGISGSVTVGNRVVFGGGVGVADHMTVGDDAIIMGGSGIGRHVPANSIWAGAPALPRDEKLGEMLAVGRLPKIIRELDRLKREVAQIKKED